MNVQFDPRLITEVAFTLSALDPDKRCDVLLQGGDEALRWRLVKGYSADAAGDIALAFHNAVAAELLRDKPAGATADARLDVAIAAPAS